ncbi:PREDICTED: ATP synthase subunit e, mitochondrial-like [Polistes canadensis]|uniref:ATP synthase subunit e, mitochondrial-like n=1 Tax=Polistes canadensis TaxID=91411 RepID=UPI000718F1CC|nr:PREDICTED: ATP synthase subunit e, mitochondrial-like [Polistes canadensis]KAI4477431.1 hypothetical protein M0804_012817 [Polistes exclamans]
MVNKKFVYLPYEISPLIKFARWTFLIVGIVYGFNKHKKYHALESALREEEERIKPIREAQLAREKAIRTEIELQELEKLFLNSSFVKESKKNLVNEE